LDAFFIYTKDASTTGILVGKHLAHTTGTVALSLPEHLQPAAATQDSSTRKLSN
jgi:hypothetical protein